MYNTFTEYHSIQELDHTLDERLPFLANLHLSRLINTAISSIETAVRHDEPDITKIAKDHYQNYRDALLIMQNLVLRGFNPFMDETWARQPGEHTWFRISYAEMLNMLSDETKKKLKKGTSL